MTSGQDPPQARTARSRRRCRESSPRARSVRFSLTNEEYGEVGAAAAHAGMAKGAYAACATLAAAREMVNPAESPFRQALETEWLPVWLPKIEKGLQAELGTSSDLQVLVGTAGFEPATP
jgi:hypothetical protein